MACFLVPATEAIITTVVASVIRKKEQKEMGTTQLGTRAEEAGSKIRFSTKLGWLNKLLWGGAFLLAFEHIWHGEVVPFFPFLTAVSDGETAGMLQEMATAGVGMAVLVTATWGLMLWVVSILEKREASAPQTAVEGA